MARYTLADATRMLEKFYPQMKVCREREAAGLCGYCGKKKGTPHDPACLELAPCRECGTKKGEVRS